MRLLEAQSGRIGTTDEPRGCTAGRFPWIDEMVLELQAVLREDVMIATNVSDGGCVVDLLVVGATDRFSILFGREPSSRFRPKERWGTLYVASAAELADGLFDFVYELYRGHRALFRRTAFPHLANLISRRPTGRHLSLLPRAAA